ncbi:MAG: methyl-accepting chemotaxis protein, partial [Gammaproteobacteria bacterium]|nr:methyl-accepting chemotaxis protein [Gammaproteobacteria bacterium]
GTVNMNADNAVAADGLVKTTRDAAATGTTVVRKAAEAMGKISEASSEIAEIIGLIDSIAFQTNLLALNAAVEAARAGEHGRGFAVVANEVRALAQRSSDASKEIRQLIETSGERVNEGESLVQQSADSLEQIMDKVKKLTDLMGEINSASQEQSKGIEQVNSAVSQLDSVNQQNSAMTEELASVSLSLNADAREMQQGTSVFTLNEQGQHCSTMAHKKQLDPAPTATTTLTRKSTPALPTAAARKTQKPAAAASDGEWNEF